MTKALAGILTARALMYKGRAFIEWQTGRTPCCAVRNVWTADYLIVILNEWSPEL